MKNNSKKKIVLLGLFLFIFVFIIFFIPIHQAKAAGEFINLAFGGIAKLVNGILQANLKILAGILAIVGKLFDIFFYIEEYSKAPLVQKGWSLVRDFTNMFFAFILLIIAFGTILGKETYGMKKLLPQLIIVALLINFSLFIAGAVVDFSQIFLHYFVDSMRGPDGILHFSQKISHHLAVDSLVKPKKDLNLWQQMTGASASYLLGGFIGLWTFITSGPQDIELQTTIAVSSVFGIIFLFLAIFVFLGGFLLLFYRMMALWTLMIGAPIIWLGSILPETVNYVKSWWSQFLNQCMVGPVYFFFIYLTIRFIDEGGLERMAAKITEGGLLLFSLQYLSIIGLMTTGLIVAPKIGGAGAASAVGLAIGVKKAATNWLRGAGGAGVTAMAARPGVQTAFAGAADWMAKRWGLRQLAEPTRVLAERLTRKKDIGEREKAIEYFPVQRIQEIMKTAMGRSDLITQMAAANILSKKGKLKANTAIGLTDKDIERTIGLAKGYGLEKMMYLNRLDIAQKNLTPKDFKELITKAKPEQLEAIRKEDIEKIPEVLEAIKEALISGEWKNNHLKNLAEDSPAIAEIVNVSIIQPGRGTFAPHIEKYLKSMTGQALFGEPKESEKSKKSPIIIATQGTPIPPPGERREWRG